MTDVTGVAIPQIDEKTLKIREIPTPVVNRLGMTVLLFCATFVRQHLLDIKRTGMTEIIPVLVFYFRASFAFSTRAAKAAASWIAISDRLLRFISMPAFFRPFMNLE